MSKELPVVVIDPGHGGTKKVGGSSANNATGPNGLLEKNLTLDIARRIPALLAKEARVILTRTSDTNVGLKARADVARKNGAALFLSIHLNGFDKPSVDGTEVWVAKDAPRRSRDFAATVLKQLLPVTKVADRGVREADFGMIRTSRHAAETAVCLAEVAFLTNPAQAKRFEDESYRQQLAEALAEGVRRSLPARVAAAAHGLAYGSYAPAAYGASAAYGYGGASDYGYGGALDYGGYATELRGAPKKSTAAELKWVDITKTKGGDGKEHLYYLVDGQTAIFHLRVKNTNDVYNFQNVTLKVRLSVMQADGTFKRVPLKEQDRKDPKTGETVSVEYKTVRFRKMREIPDESTRVFEIGIAPETMAAAYDAMYKNRPVGRLDVEFHWREGETFRSWLYNESDPLQFLLVKPFELLESKKTRLDTLNLGDEQHRDDWWIWVDGKEFSAADQQPMEVTSTIQVTDSKSAADEKASGSSGTSNVTREKGTETTITVGGEYGKKDVWKVSGSFSQKWSSKVTKSVTGQFFESIKSTWTYVASEARSKSVKNIIAPGPLEKGETVYTKAKELYVYPTVEFYEVPFITYGGRNSLGQATSRSESATVLPRTIRFTYKVIVRDPKQDKQVTLPVGTKTPPRPSPDPETSLRKDFPAKRSQSLAAVDYDDGWDEAEAFDAKPRKKRRGQESPAQWAKDRRKEGLRRFDEFGDEFVRQSKAVFPGVPAEALMGFTLNGKVKENTTGFITGLEDERPPKRERPPLGGVSAQKFHELGMFGVEGGPREGPAPAKDSAWTEAANSDEVKSLLGRPGNTKPGGWLSVPDQIAIGLTNTRRHGRSVIKHKSFPAQARPATENSLWFVALSFMAWSAGDGRAAQHVSNFSKELAAVPEGRRWGTFVRLLAEAGKKCTLKAGPVKHASPFYSAVRTLQKIEAGRLLATERGSDLAFFDDGLGAERDDIHTTLTRLANEGNLEACKTAGVAAQALGGGDKKAPAPTTDQIVKELDAKLGTSYGTYDNYTKTAVKSGSVFGKGIGNGVHADFLKKLQQGEKDAAALIHPNGAAVTAQEWGVKSIGGLQSRKGQTGWHPWGLAVDIDYYENPYIMHTAGESSLDKLLGPVYHRIARLMLQRDSVIPEEIIKPRKKGETAAQRTSRLYDALSEESVAMKGYFALMLDAQKLEQRLQSIGSDWRTRVLADATSQDASGLQKLMMRDYVVLSGREGPAVGGLTYPDPVMVHGKGKAGEAPFFVGKGKDQKLYQSLIARRAPENGFLTIRKEIVTALSAAGLRWGAIDFGGASGDVMHFDDGNGKFAAQIVAARKEAQQKLASSAAQSYGLANFAVDEDGEELDDEGLPLSQPLSRPALTAKEARFAPDNVSPDYRHLGASGVSQSFDFTADMLERLCQLNGFNPNLKDDENDDREVIFALRGCTIVGATASGEEKNAFVSTLKLSEDLPDHQKPHCVIGVWRRAARQLAAFVGSTVPYWGSMEKFRQGGPASNMLLTGRHLYTVGTHRGGSNLEIKGALLQQGPVVVVRTFDDLSYETTDTFEVGNVGDNIHPSRFPLPTDRYSSQGCLTVPGTYDLKHEKYTGLWSRFRGALGLNPASPKGSEDGRRFVCILLTGREARLISQNANAPLKRLRFGSQGADVTALQNALIKSGHFKGKVSGKMEPSTTIAYINWQRAQEPANPSADGIKKP
jgi:N-acetylmuramoyl-L-alanine amidase